MCWMDGFDGSGGVCCGSGGVDGDGFGVVCKHGRPREFEIFLSREGDAFYRGWVVWVTEGKSDASVSHFHAKPWVANITALVSIGQNYGQGGVGEGVETREERRERKVVEEEEEEKWWWWRKKKKRSGGGGRRGARRKERVESAQVGWGSLLRRRHAVWVRGVGGGRLNGRPLLLAWPPPSPP